MNDKKFPFLAVNYVSDKDSDYSEKEYKKKEFALQKYEKFKPKAIENYYKTKTLKGAENKVKNLLSHFLKNYEKEKRNSDVMIEFNKNQKNKEINNLKHKNKKHLIKKVRTSVNNNNANFLKLNSFNISLNKENKNNKLNVISEHNYYNNNNNHSQKRKVAFNLNQSDSTNNNNNSNKDSTKKKSKKNVKNNFHVNVSRTIKNKLKINDFIKKTTSFGAHVLKKNKTGVKVENKNNNTIVHINSISGNDNINDTNNSIKKTQSVLQNNSYLNFKNDNILINKIHNNNAISVKASLKKKKGILKNKNKNKKEVFNESIQNSLLSDLSDYYLNRKSFDMKNSFKEDDSSKKENKNSLIFSSSKKSSLILNKNLTNLNTIKKNSKDFSIVSSKHSSIQKSLSPKRTKKSNFNNNKVKRAETSIDKKNRKKERSGELQRLDTHFRSLKEQLKKSLILCPEDLDIDFNSEKKKDKNRKKIKPKKMKSLILNYNNNIKLISKGKSSKSNKNILKISSILNEIKTGLIEEQNKQNNNLKKENINNNINTVEHITNLEENKTFDKNDNLESKKTLKSVKSVIESSNEEYSIYSIKRKNTLFYQKYRVLTHKGNVYDSLDDEEIEDEEEIDSLYLEPNSLFTIIFDSILFFFTIISLIEIPFYLAMNKNFCRNKTITINFAFNFFIDLLNIVDLCLGFFRAYYDWEEQLIKKNKIMELQYLSGWFLFDLVASVPIYTINKFYEPKCIENGIISKYSNTVLDNLHYLLIANRLFKVFKVFLNNQAWKIISNKLNDYGSIILYISLVYAAINYTACFYIFVARNSFPNWIFEKKLDTQSFINIYICAIYILTMAVTTVGYGDITCYCMNEIFFQLFILIIGIIGYSYVVSFVSNYIVKINEKSVDFEKKKEILDEIRLSHPNLPDELYDRILRYLKFKNFQEKKLINIIFDCLPVGLKNNLISEMYKPIIKNFIFFKNFQNTDFIVRVILAFKPIIAYKNDILVNEGDMVEDIMFVKKGVLSVELPINMLNPQENIDKFLTEPMLAIEKGPNVEKIGNSTIIQGSRPSSKTMFFNSTMQEQDLNAKNSLSFNTSSLSSFFTNKYSRTLNTRPTKIEKERKEREERELERRKHLTFVKILGIRENEHFGDVLMFLEERSPLRVRVRSIKCELFFLKKIDAVKISTNYQNIWKRINKKSVFNFEQMKKSIKNIVEIYCAVKTIKSNHVKKFSNKIGIKGKNTNLRRNKSDSNISALRTIKEEEYVKNSQSQKNIKIDYIKLFNNNEINDDFILQKNNDINLVSSAVNLERKKNFFLQNTNIKLSLNSSNSSLSSIISTKNKKKAKNNNKNNVNNVFKENYFDKQMKFGQNVLDVFNRNYKYYKGTEIMNNNESKKQNNTIISEETEQEGTIENKLNSIIKMSKIPSIGNRVYSSKIVNNALSNKSLKKNSKKEEYSESDNSYNKIINNELNVDEVINIIKEENLLNKKIDLDILSTKQSEINNITNNSLEFKNSKLQILLKLFENENDITQKDKYIINKENIINENSDENINSSINNENVDEIGIESKNLVSDKNVVYNFDNNSNDNNSKDSSEISAIQLNNMNENITKPILTKKSNVFLINNNISFKIDSSYENFNIISGKILIKNKILQNKLKNYLLDEIQNISDLDTINRNNIIDSEEIKKINSFEDTKNIKDKNNKFINSPKIDKRKSSPFEFRKNQLIKKKDSISYHYSKSIDKKSKRLDNSCISLNENIFPKNKKDKIDKNTKIVNKFQTGIGIELDNSLFNNNRRGKKRRLSQHEILNKNLNKINIINNNINYINNSVVDFQKKIKPSKISSIKKKRDNNLLSQINLNIQKTNQNLNNPEEFYSSYFNSLLEGKMNDKTTATKRNSVFYARENTNNSKLSKEKLNKSNLYKINQS